ncbi:cache domain-containing protein [Methanogenium marinum]|uniref:Cache domain-containing protein n=1 Tax=Methanogenium marinum TaxID=348610 RepID=A0A9Q4KUT0_9EURY|nr:cache domain-containing protein [Methanogenium marinum]MDE4907695.1 cache domain-containing protein [Methanogenium marinum]
MKRSFSLFITITAITVMLCCAGCITAEEPPSTAITGDQLEEYVHTAATYAKTVDKDEALAAFSDPNGPYVKENLYIYAYDFNGTLIAHPFQPDKVGTDRTNWTTANGLHFVEAASDAAQDGSGYIVYMYPTPGEELNIDEDMKNLYEVKLGYVEQVDDTWWVGSGIYLSDYTDATTGVLPAKIAEMTALTESAVTYAHENGTPAALTEIDKQDGLFTDGNLYLYAYDYNGTLVAHPYLAPGMIGTDLSGYVGPYGVPVIQTCAETAINGGGFVVFGWENPAKGGASELKLGYVLPVDDNWWVGSGLYISDIFGDDESTTESPKGRTLADVVDFVTGACDHADTVGKEQALTDFGDKNGAFVDGNLYLYVEDFNGVTLAHPIHPQKVGTSRLNATDPNGLLLVKGLCDTAAEGDGYFLFMYQDPADNFTLSPKLGYVKKAGDDWWVGSGVYLADLVDPATGDPLPVITGLTGFVKEAQDYAQSMGKDAALTTFRDPAGYFADTPHPVYAFSKDGILLAGSTRPDAEGTDLTDSIGEYGVPYVTDGAKMAENGGGYLIYTPQGEGQRLDYILPVDDDWWIGAGIPVSVIVDESSPAGV